MERPMHARRVQGPIQPDRFCILVEKRKIAATIEALAPRRSCHFCGREKIPVAMYGVQTIRLHE